MGRPSFFSPEEPLWSVVSAVADALALSLLWTVCALPVVTAGAATAALYRSALTCLRPMEHGAVKTFLRTLRSHLRPALPLTLAVAALGLGGVWCLQVLSRAAAESATAYVLFFTAAVVCLFLLGWAGYLFPTLSRFFHTPLGLMQLCAALSLAHLPTTVALGALLALSAAALWHYWVLIAFLPAVTALLTTFLLEPVYRRHGGEAP